MTFGIIALSVFIGWLAWRITEEYVTPVKRAPNGTTIHHLAPFTSILLGLFVMTHLVHPAIDHYFPSFWNYAASQIGQPPTTARTDSEALPSEQAEPLKLLRVERVFAPRGCQLPAI